MNYTLCFQLIHFWQSDNCTMPRMADLCQCAPFFTYEGYYLVFMLAVIVFVCMSVLYSITCRRIYFCSHELQTNTNHVRQVGSKNRLVLIQTLELSKINKLSTGVCICSVLVWVSTLYADPLGV